MLCIFDDVLIDVNSDISSEYTVKDGTRIIAGGAFSLSEITKITIPDSVQYIGHDAFSYCFELKSVKLSNSLKTLGKSAFSVCRKLKSITIPGSVKTIEEYSFCDCSELSDVTIASGVENIYGGAFLNCKLSKIFVPNSVKYISDDVFGYNYSGINGSYIITEPKLTIICSKDSAAYKYAKEFKVDVKIV